MSLYLKTDGAEMHSHRKGHQFANLPNDNVFASGDTTQIWLHVCLAFELCIAVAKFDENDPIAVDIRLVKENAKRGIAFEVIRCKMAHIITMICNLIIHYIHIN